MLKLERVGFCLTVMYYLLFTVACYTSAAGNFQIDYFAESVLTVSHFDSFKWCWRIPRIFTLSLRILQSKQRPLNHVLLSWKAANQGTPQGKKRRPHIWSRGKFTCMESNFWQKISTNEFRYCCCLSFSFPFTLFFFFGEGVFGVGILSIIFDHWRKFLVTNKDSSS